MAEKEMVRYVREHLGEGFSEDDLKLELVKRGHNVSDVEAAIKEAKIPQKEKPKKSYLKFLVLLTIIIAVGIVLFFVFMQLRGAELIKEQELTQPVIVPPSPEAAPEVLPEEVPPYIPPELPAEEAPEAAPEEAVLTGRQIPIYNISRMSFNLTPRLQVIKDISIQNPDAAVAMCTDFHTDEERDLCFAALARNIPDVRQCSRIAEQILRDQCYVSFAVAGIDACDKVNDTEIQESCNQLIRLNLTGSIY